jgi:S1-C subfamily serine protease
VRTVGVLVGLLGILNGLASGVVQDSMGSVVQVVFMKNVSCSGVVWDQERVVTAAHCIPKILRDALEIRFLAGPTRKVDVERVEDGLDLAVLKFSAYDQAKPVRLAFSALVGSEVYIIGHPHGIPWVVVHGILAGVFPQVRVETLGDDGRMFGTSRRDLFLTDAKTAQGFSGGGWFDEYGRLSAVHVMTLRAPSGEGLFGAGVGYTTVREWMERR